MKELTLFQGTLSPKTYEGQRVVTLRDIDELHCKPDGTARKRFNDNRKHFIDGVDTFVRNPDEARQEYGIEAPNGLRLLTLTGYLMIVKSFNDDLSWAIQRELVTGYFSGRKQGYTFMGTPVITTREYCKATGEDLSSVRYRMLRHYRDYPLGSVMRLDGYHLKLFKEENPGVEVHANALWIMTRQGAELVRDNFRQKRIT